MRLRDNYRVPLLLLACFVTALMFPRACTETRVGFGALLPATAPLTGAESQNAEATLREENARLAHEIGRLEEEREARPSAEGPAANARIVRPVPRPPVAILARVRHRDASSQRRSFSIDAGRADGVRAGLPVIFGGSIVGLVASAAEHSALVVRIDDPTTASTLPATFIAPDRPAGDRRPSGVARGTGDGEVAVSLLRSSDAKPGDIAVTGVGNPLVPEGLVLGEVVRFGDDDRDGSHEADVRPLRDLDTLNSVFVLRVDGDSFPAAGPGAKR